MFLYRFLRRPQVRHLCISFLVGLMALTCRLPGLFSYGICYISAKDGRLPRNEKKHINWAIGINMAVEFHIDHHIDLKFSRWNMELAISQPKRVRSPRNEKQVYRLNTKPQMWPLVLILAMTLTLNFQDQIWNSFHLMTRCSDCHEMKNGRIDWILGLTWSHQLWRWSWSWL